MPVNTDVLGLRDAVCADTEEPSVEYAAALGLSHAAAVAAVAGVQRMHGPGQNSAWDLEEDEFFLKRQVIIFESRACGMILQPDRIRELCRALSLTGASSLCQIAELYPSPPDLATIVWLAGSSAASAVPRPVLSGPERVVPLVLAKHLQEIHAARAKVGERKDRPTRQISVDDELKKYGFGLCDADLLVSQDCVNRVLLAMERKDRLLPYFEIKLEPWALQTWKRSADASMKAQLSSVAAETLECVTKEVHDALGLTGTENAAERAAAKRTLDVQKERLSTGLRIAALNRLLQAYACAGAFGPAGGAVAYGYTSLICLLAAEHGADVASAYDEVTRRVLGEKTTTTLSAPELVRRLLHKEHNLLTKLVSQSSIRASIAAQTKGSHSQQQQLPRNPKDPRDPPRRFRRDRSRSRRFRDGSRRRPSRGNGRGRGSRDRQRSRSRGNRKKSPQADRDIPKDVRKN